MNKSTTGKINRYLKNMRKFARRGNMEAYEYNENKLKDLVLTTLGNKESSEARKNMPIVPPKERFVNIVSKNSGKSSLTFAPKSGRIELKIHEDVTDEEREAYKKIAINLKDANDLTSNLTLRGSFGRNGDQEIVSSMKSNNKEVKYTARQ